MEIEEIKIIYDKLNNDIDFIKNLFDEEKLKLEKKECDEICSSADFWLIKDKAQKTNDRINKINEKLYILNKIKNMDEDIKFDIEYISQFGQSENELQNLKRKIEEFKKVITSTKINLTLNSEYDNSRAIISIHAGAGGTEAQDWVDMLFRMYKMYASKNGYKIEMIDALAGDGAGYKNISFFIGGNYAYGHLKCEKGVHRLVRISPFDSSSRRHTSFASVSVTPELSDDINIYISPEDLKIDTYRASGAGGQHVNKTESAIRITHIPSGIVVNCQNERSQLQNKEICMKILKSKLLEREKLLKEETLLAEQGNLKKIEWGSQIRSYVFCPYTLVKDHRTNYEISDVTSVMDGNIGEFIEAYLFNLTNK